MIDIVKNCYQVLEANVTYLLTYNIFSFFSFWALSTEIPKSILLRVAGIFSNVLDHISSIHSVELHFMYNEKLELHLVPIFSGTKKTWPICFLS